MESIFSDPKKQTMLSGVQPTGIFTLGNYIGAIKNWRKVQNDYNCLYFIANLHSLTVRNDPQKLKKLTLDCVALLLACGIDIEKSILFIQSHVPEHTELSWVLQCYTQFGELTRMTQFKDKSAKNADNVNAGLFGYPVLMAADILIYQSDFVPIGADQKQHLELTRDIANRFNNLYGETFNLPNPYIPQSGGRVMSLANPTSKMSKSDKNLNGFISVLDPPDVIINKFKKAVTDSESKIYYSDEKPGISNLLTIYSVLANLEMSEVEEKFRDKGYGEFKLAVGELVAETLKPIQDKYNQLSKDKKYLQEICDQGAKKASSIAQKTLKSVYEKIGI